MSPPVGKVGLLRPPPIGYIHFVLAPSETLRTVQVREARPTMEDIDRQRRRRVTSDDGTRCRAGRETGSGNARRRGDKSFTDGGKRRDEQRRQVTRREALRPNSPIEGWTATTTGGSPAQGTGDGSRCSCRDTYSVTAVLGFVGEMTRRGFGAPLGVPQSSLLPRCWGPRVVIPADNTLF